jgi:ankyrin repeat protein
MLSRLLVIIGALSLAGSGARSQPALGPAELYWLLDRACVHGDEMSVQMLLNAGADPTGVQGYEAFHRSPYQVGFEPSWPINQAARGGHTAVIRLLLTAGAKADAPEDEGQTALLIAAYRGDLDTVRLLLEAGADKSYDAPAGVSGDFVGTAEVIAAKAGHSEVASFIRGFGAPK